jgi:DNA anti-recombination protein RmuC
MYKMRDSWTDERLDDFAKHVDHRFDEVDRRFGEVDRRFDKVDAELHRVNDRLGGLHRTLLQIAGGTIATLIAGFAGIIATQL